MTDKLLTEMYHEMINICINEKGVYPHQAMAISHDGKTHVMALALSEPYQVLPHVAKMIASNDYKELIWSLDRMCLDGQGTTLGDCVAGCHWDGEKFIPFIIEYQHDPRIVKEIEYDNSFWNEMLSEEIEKVQGIVSLLKRVA